MTSPSKKHDFFLPFPGERLLLWKLWLNKAICKPDKAITKDIVQTSFETIYTYRVKNKVGEYNNQT